MLFFVEAVANEKGLARADVFDALEYALATAIRKLQHEDMDVRVEMDQVSGDFKAYRCWTVVANDEEEFEEATMLKLMDAEDEDPNAVIGDVLEETLDAPPIGRIGAQTARQIMMQKLREASRRKVVEQYEPRIGEVFMGTVKRMEREGIVIDISDNVEGLLPREHQIVGEHYRIGSRVRALLWEIDVEVRGPQLIFSRTDNEFLSQLFSMEVPEVSDGIIDIKAVAREPGIRAKVAVFTGDPHLDVIGACVGMRGSRVQAVMTELNGERIDVIQWNANPAQFVISAMSPAEIRSLLIDEERGVMDLSVSDEMLSQAIGKSGQNVRLASELTGWVLNAMSETQMKELEGRQQVSLRDLLEKELEVDESIAKKLVNAGFTSIEEIAYVAESELLSIDGLNGEIVTKIRDKANDILLMQMLENPE